MPSAEQLEAFNDIAECTLDDLNLTLEESKSHLIDIDTCRSSIDNLAMAAEIVELESLGELCKAFSDNLSKNALPNHQLTPTAIQEIVDWSSNLIALIRSPEDPLLIEKVVESLPEEAQENFICNFVENRDTHQEQDLAISETLAFNSENILDLPCPVEQDPVSLFIHELKQLEPKLDQIINDILACGPSDTHIYIEQYFKKLQLVKETSSILSFSGIERICDFLILNIESLDPNKETFPAVWLEAVSPSLGLIIEYLNDFNDPNKLIDLVGHLEQDTWPIRNSEQSSHQLVDLLSAIPTINFEQEIETPNKREATLEDIHLNNEGKLNPELLSAFLHDSPAQASALNECINSLAADEFLPTNLEKAQRLTHTIKGAANVVDIPGIANLAHYMEEIFEKLYQFPEEFNFPLVSLLQEAADVIEAMIDHLMGRDQTPENAQFVLQKLLDYINEGHISTTSKTLTPKHHPKTSVGRTAQAKEDILDHQGSNIQASIEELAPNTITIDETIQVSTRTIDHLFRTAEEMTIALIHTREQIKQMIDNGQHLNTQDDKIQQHRFELEKLIDIKTLASAKKRFHYPAPSNDDHFDSLEMDQYDELHGAVHSFIETVTDSRELTLDLQEQLLDLDTLFLKQLRLNKDLQFLAKATKMVPIQSIASRLQRCVRHAARLTGKQVSLMIEDNGLEIDEEILLGLTDPLMHLLRNAVDHGVEHIEKRDKISKPTSGQITISFNQDGHNIKVSIQDDGAGINPSHVLHKAKEKGFVDSKEYLTDEEVFNLLLKSGFSTKSEANQLSGRGVGLDVVFSAIQSLHGDMNIESNLGEGTLISLSVPVANLSTHAIIITLNYERYAIPSRALSQLLPPRAGEIIQMGAEKGYRYNDTIYPLITLGEIIYGKSRLNKQDLILNNLPVLFIVFSGTTYALAVDSILNSQEIIIKPLGGPIEKVNGIQGVAIIADGTLIPVLDINELIQKQHLNEFIAPSKDSAGSAEQQRSEKRDQVMIVDDSLSVRRSLDQLMRDTGYTTILARDGLQAIELLKTHKPKVILADMEMPRMNGLEMTAQIKRSETYQSIFVIMITSRSTQKHRHLAEQSGVNHYLTKPYTETHLLDLIAQHQNSEATNELQ